VPQLVGAIDHRYFMIRQCGDACAASLDGNRAYACHCAPRAARFLREAPINSACSAVATKLCGGSFTGRVPKSALPFRKGIKSRLRHVWGGGVRSHARRVSVRNRRGMRVPRLTNIKYVPLLRSERTHCCSYCLSRV
jgi:hypothetical protein